MSYEQQRVEIINMCRQMEHLGFFIGTWGNVSMRVDEFILLTPSRVSYDCMKPEDLVLIDLQGNRIQGERTATSEKEVHRQIYLVRPEIGAVIHAHTKKAMAVSATHTREVPCMVEEMAQLLGGTIPVAKQYIPAKQHFELGKLAAETIGDKNGVILPNHGPVACGKDLEEAALVVKVMEKACEIYLSVLGKMAIQEIPQQFVESERYRYLHTYGKEKT